METPTKVKDESKDATETSKQSDGQAAITAITTPGVAVDAAADASSKKRAREPDDEVEEQRSTKKIDSRVEES